MTTWQSDNVDLYLDDARFVLIWMKSNSIDSIITDPPYNAINRDTGGLRQIDKGKADSSLIDIAKLGNEFIRIARGSIYVWCSDEQYTGWMTMFTGQGFTTRKCAWWKTNPSPMNGQHLWLSALELCAFMRKPGAPFYRFCAAPLWKGPSERVDGFPTPKPVWLMKELIGASVPVGGTVLDPFMGSGTTGVACVQTGRKFIGIEIDPGYFEIAKKRIMEAQAQMRLPGMEAT